MTSIRSLLLFITQFLINLPKSYRYKVRNQLIQTIENVKISNVPDKIYTGIIQQNVFW